MNKKKNKAKKGFSTLIKMIAGMNITGVLTICYALLPFWLYLLCGLALLTSTWYALKDAGETFSFLEEKNE